MEGLEYINCPFCGSNDFHVHLKTRDFLFSQEEFSVVKCNKCGLYFTNPRVREENISSYYFSGYAGEGSNKRLNIFRKIKRFASYIIGDANHELLDELRSIKAKTVLEIGPGAGNLLYYLKDHGFEVVGAEIDTDCARKLRENGIICYLGNLNDIKEQIGRKKFDVVILCHSFEHLYRPRKTLENIQGLLNDGGFIYLVVPNIDSWEAKVFKEYWRGLDLPRHIFHYNDKMIKGLLAENGFCIVKSDNQIFPSSFVESIAFWLFKGKKIPSVLYYSLYYPWKLLSPIHQRLIGSGVFKIIARKV